MLEIGQNINFKKRYNKNPVAHLQVYKSPHPFFNIK